MARRWALGLGPPAACNCAEQALAMAREVDDAALLARALTSYGLIAGYSSVKGQRRRPVSRRRAASPANLVTSGGSARSMPGRLTPRSVPATLARCAPRQSWDAMSRDAIGNAFDSRECRLGVGWAQLMSADVSGRDRAVPRGTRRVGGRSGAVSGARLFARPRHGTCLGWSSQRGARGLARRDRRRD